MRTLTLTQVLVVVLAGLSSHFVAAPAGAAARDAERHFEQQVRPLLLDKCVSCHGPEKQKGKLRVDSLAAILRGGESGPALVPGKPAESRLLLAVTHADADLKMPPKEKLGEPQVAALRRWVADGAPWPGAPAGPPAGGEPEAETGPRKRSGAEKGVVSAADRDWWSYRPVRRAAPPVVRDAAWVRNDIDRFVLAKLDAAGLAPAPPAERRDLLRRLSFDLVGMAPTPAEVAAFVSDTAEDAYEKVVDRLLADPRYGETWARHWLDVVRYAESDGYKQDSYRPSAWRYRDYVIRSLNADKPYDRFIAEQLAGDELYPGDHDALVATGFLRQGMYEYNQADVRGQWRTILEDVTDVAGDALLAMGLGCARCHDHKFDPILQRDYHALQAFFAPMAQHDDTPVATAEQSRVHAAKQAAWEKKTRPLRDQLAAMEKPKALGSRAERFPPEIQAIVLKPAAARSPYEEQIARLTMRQLDDPENKTSVPADKKKQWEELRKQLEALNAELPAPLPSAMTVGDIGPVAPPTTIPGKSEAGAVPPAFPTVLGDGASVVIPPVSSSPDTTGRRAALAAWLGRAEHPLTARVIVNRLWQHHFGTGLVATANDFGRLGEAPSHPELLDHLAVGLIDAGWKLKAVHRLIVTSAAYRQSARRTATDLERRVDPANRLLWRMSPRRLDAEAIRDAALAASGELDLAAGGPGVGGAEPRRSVYLKVLRNTPDPVLEAFDAAAGFQSTDRRNLTNTSRQALLMINGEWTLKRAGAMAQRVLRENPGQAGAEAPAALARAAFQAALQRGPTARELEAAVALLKRGGASPLASAPTRAPDMAAPTPSPESPADVADTEPMPARGSRSLVVRLARTSDFLSLADHPALPTGDFTVEAVVLLRSIYEDASVRVIASKWSGDQARPGWSLGVTGAKSRHGPRNLILQLAGKSGPVTAGPPALAYTVLASGLKLELHRAYYVAAQVRVDGAADRGVTFHALDLSDADATRQTATLRHDITGGHANTQALVIGGRDGDRPHGWDGLIDEVRLSRGTVPAEQSLAETANPLAVAGLAGLWRFEETPGVLRDEGKIGLHLRRGLGRGTPPRAAETKPGAGIEANALADLCHVLLNSNEFLFVD